MKRVVAGPNAVTEAIRAAPGDVGAGDLADGLTRAAADRLERLCRDADVPCSSLPREALDALAKGLTHQGVVALAGDYPYVDLEAVLSEGRRVAEPLLVVLDQIQDPGNLGAIVRSAHALGATGVILTRDRSASMTPAAVRASAGASELIRVARVGNLAQCLDHLRDSGYRVLGAAADAEARVDDVDRRGPTALVLGGEGKGLRRLTREHCDLLFRIPLATAFDSLNVSVAAAVALYELGRARDRVGR
jgi:23S rRNA (guanosine2251-2'-O)-methyltransferase